MTECELASNGKHCHHLIHNAGNDFWGRETYQCCWCGESIYRSWKNIPDPKHGVYAPPGIKVYDNE